MTVLIAIRPAWWLVAKGYTQTYGIDYQETFAPIAMMNFICIFISLAVHKGWPLLQLDIKNVFLHGDLKEVYMKTPLGFLHSTAKGKVSRFRKALYRLKQSPCAWFEQFNFAMTKRGHSKVRLITLSLLSVKVIL